MARLYHSDSVVALILGLYDQMKPVKSKECGMKYFVTL